MGKASRVVHMRAVTGRHFDHCRVAPPRRQVFEVSGRCDLAVAAAHKKRRAMAGLPIVPMIAVEERLRGH